MDRVESFKLLRKGTGMTARLANQTFANRRSFLVASGVGFAGLAFGRPGMAAPETVVSPSKPAKSTILFFLCGGASHLDMWDLKSNAPDDYRGPFQPIATSAT
ncbi:MAG: DUF1501 domain-containing protein, partial [Planctomycetales bacterium]|nr:DUF1501 domain-containing protein [Planctomycetales bacterium]